MAILGDWLVGGVAAMAAGAVWYWRRRTRTLAEERERQTSARLSRSRTRKPYQAVSIAQNPDSCMAARRLAEQRFLAPQAPALPLPGCDQPHCMCHYAYHDDRRELGDRRAPIINNLQDQLIAAGKWCERQPDRRQLH